MEIFKKNENQQSDDLKGKSLLDYRKGVIEAEDLLIEQLIAECHRLFEEEKPSKEELGAFFAVFHQLSPRVAGIVGYEMAKMNLSYGRSGFHGGFMQNMIHMPFEFFSWAGYKEWGGIAFEIHRASFKSEQPRLYFCADTTPYIPKKAFSSERYEDVKTAIKAFSSEIEDITVETEIEQGSRRCRIEFSLTARGHKPYIGIDLQNGHIDGKWFEDPVIQIPIIGEFNCVFGEVTSDGDVVLHRDGFCMK